MGKQPLEVLYKQIFISEDIQEIFPACGIVQTFSNYINTFWLGHLPEENTTWEDTVKWKRLYQM